MSNLPKRPKQHEIDSKGLAILQYKLSPHFIFRSITERDYGIDALLEMTEGGSVTGKFITVQVKSKGSIHWNKKNQFKEKINSSTVNYWMNNNDPVLIFLVDCEKEIVYFANAKRQARENYSQLSSSGVSFEFLEENDITSDVGLVRMLASIFIENDYQEFISAVKDFVMNLGNYNEHLESNQGRDFFLFVDEEQIDMTRHIYKVLMNINNYLLISLPTIPTKEIREKSLSIYEAYYKDNFYEIIEWENSELNFWLEKWKNIILPGLKHLIFEKECNFWSKKHPTVVKQLGKVD